MPGDTINYTPAGWPYLDDENYWDVAPAYSEELAAKLEQGMPPAAHTHNANDITAGTLNLARIPNLPASKVASGTLDPARLPADPYLIVGAGRPDITGTLAPDVATRVAAATSGAVFRSTDGPQGAWEWQKQGNAWAVTQGDTRYRNASDSLLSGWTGRIDIRRIGRMVDVFLYDLTAGAGAADDFINIPTGYRPRYRTNPYESWVVSNRSLSGTPTVRRAGAYGSALRMYGKDASDGMTGHLTFFTEDGWPTTLPWV